MFQSAISIPRLLLSPPPSPVFASFLVMRCETMLGNSDWYPLYSFLAMCLVPTQSRLNRHLPVSISTLRDRSLTHVSPSCQLSLLQYLGKRRLRVPQNRKAGGLFSLSRDVSHGIPSTKVSRATRSDTLVSAARAIRESRWLHADSPKSIGELNTERRDIRKSNRHRAIHSSSPLLELLCSYCCLWGGTQDWEWFAGEVVWAISRTVK